MQKLAVHLSGGERIELILPRLKILFGNNHGLIFQIFMAIEEHFSKYTTTEYAKEHFREQGVCLDDFPLSPRDSLLFRIDPYFDFSSDMKMGSTSLLYRYAETLLHDLPYEDNFSTLATAYQFLESETIAEALALDCDSIKMTFDLEPLTPKFILKLISGRIMKDDCVAGRYDLTRSESIRLQVALIQRLVKRTDKHAIVLYDGPLERNDLALFAYPEKSDELEQITYIVATASEHEPLDLDLVSYAIMSHAVIDLADWSSAEHAIGMDLPWHWDEGSLKANFRRYIAGEWDKEALYLRKILNHCSNTRCEVD